MEGAESQGAHVLPLLQSLASLLLVTGIARLWSAENERLQLRQILAQRGQDGGGGASESPSTGGASGGRGGAAAGPAAPPIPVAPRPPLYTLVRMQVVAGLLGGIIQLLAMLTKHDVSHLLQSPAGASTPSLAVLLLLVSGMLIPALAPRWFERHRTLLFAATRVLYFSLPAIRSPRGIGYVFQSLPARGRFSKLRDLWLLTLGTRGLALLLGPVFLPLPLLQHLLVSAFAVHRIRTTADMCSLPFLRHPIWERRIQWAHLTAEMLPLVGPQLSARGGSGSSSSSAGGRGSMGSNSDAFDCRTFVLFYQLFMAVLSLLLAARLETPRTNSSMATPAAAAAAAAVAAPAAAVAAGEDGAAGGAPRQGSWIWRGARWLHGMAAEAEVLVRQLCAILTGRCWPGVVQLACWSLLLSLLWNLALLLEQPALSLPPQA